MHAGNDEYEIEQEHDDDDDRDIPLVEVGTKLRISSLHAAWLRVTPVQLKIGYNCDVHSVHS